MGKYLEPEANSQQVKVRLLTHDLGAEKMVKLVGRRIMVFIGLVGLAMLIFAVYFQFLAPVEFCDGSAGFTDGRDYLVDSAANAWAWLDNNGDGIRQPKEPWLENVCIWDSTDLEYFDEEWLSAQCVASDTEKYWFTDANGKYDGGFWAGACCNDIYIFAFLPEGYQATTPLVATGCSAEFGFVPVSAKLETNQLSLSDHVQQLEIQQREKQALHTIKTIVLVLSVVVFAVIGSFIIVRR